MSRLPAPQGSPEVIDLCVSSSEELGQAGQSDQQRQGQHVNEVINLISGPSSSKGPTAAGSAALVSDADSRPGPSQQQQVQPEPPAERQASAPVSQLVSSSAQPTASESGRPHSPQHGPQQEASAPSSPRDSPLPSPTTSGSSQSVESMGGHAAALLRCDVEPAAAALPDPPEPLLPMPGLLAAGDRQGTASGACPSPARAPLGRAPCSPQQQQQGQELEGGQQLGSPVLTSPLRAGGAAVTILPQSPVADAALADLQRLASQPASPPCRILSTLEEGPGAGILDSSRPGRYSTSAAAAHAAGAAPGPAAPPPTPLPPQQQQQQEQQEQHDQQQQPVGEAEPPDPSDSAAMLQYLRSKIPAELLAQYPGQQVVDAEDKAQADKRLQLYDDMLQHCKATRDGVPKYDMRAVKKMKAAYSGWAVWSPFFGHPPGIEVGQHFGGRCEMIAAGVHQEYILGIAYGAGEPACAVAASGGYEDDTDHGDWLIYTGMGGQNSSKEQVEDQTWTKGNLALLQAYQQNKPIRVARRFTDDENKKDTNFSYDGLYCIVDAKLEPNANGILVCKFWMVGIPGHYNVAARRVTFLGLRGFRAMRLACEQPEQAADAEPGPETSAAAAAAPARRAKKSGTKRRADVEPKRGKSKKQRAASPPSSPVAAVPALPPPQTRPGFLIDDVSGGLEAIKIPVFNEVDDEPAPTNIFTYIKTSKVPGQAAQELQRKAQALMPDGGKWCGIKQHNNKLPYTNTGLMKETETLGLWECCSSCTGKRCRLNQVATAGVKLPLEVFRVSPYKGWGVRCPVDISAGSLICTYEGEIVTSEEGERREDNYLFDLDHFVQLHNDRTVFGRARAKLLPLPADLNMEEHEHLVIDALRYGNVARFINHSCEPNLVVQPILAEGCSALRYLVAIVAARNIPAHTELSYDYNYALLNGRQLHCSCGAVKCRGRLH